MLFGDHAGLHGSRSGLTSTMMKPGTVLFVFLFLFFVILCMQGFRQHKMRAFNTQSSLVVKLY